MTKKKKVLFSLCVVCFVSFYFFANHVFEKNERVRFCQNIQERAEKGEEIIKLSDVTWFDWETVCNSHPYSGSFYLEKYKKEYIGPWSQQHDGTWVYVFIDSKGKSRYLWPESGCKILLIGTSERKQRCYENKELILRKRDYSSLPELKNMPRFEIDQIESK